MTATLVGMGPTGTPPGAHAIDDVYRAARPMLVGLVSRVVDHAEAEDVVQEAFVRLNADPVLQRPFAEITAWLRRVSLNLAFNRARDVARWHQRTEKAQTDATTAPPLDPASEACRTDERARVRAILDQLPAKQRNCLLLRHAGYSYAEIAQSLEMPASSVGTTLARGERAFADLYSIHTQGDDSR